MLKLIDVWKRYGDAVVAVGGVTLEVESGQFVSLLGPSGSGKTTTLRMVAGFEQPDRGEIWLDGERLDGLAPNRRPVNTVFQDYALFPHLNVRDNVGFGLRAQKLSRAEIDRRVGEGLELVGLEQLASRQPGQLSGGQRQRTALARALVLRPKLLLLDEPLGALDLKLRKQMQIVLMELREQVGITFLYVTHDQEEALTMSDRVAVMRDGVIEQYAPPEVLYNDPVSAFVAGFVGDTNLLDAKFVERDSQIAFVEFEGRRLAVDASGLNGVERGASVTVAIRPEAMQLADTGETETARLDATVHQSMFVAGEIRVVARTSGGQNISVRLPRRDAVGLERNAQVSLTYDAAAARAFAVEQEET
jgi:spermidine/putrescine transport system ATP-binding protein